MTHDSNLQNAGLIGRRLVEKGLITKQQLRDALIEQHEKSILLGEVCLLNGWITFEQLKTCLPAQRTRLGNKLLENQLITAEQLWLAILEQRQSGRKLGSILVSRGWVSQGDIDRLQIG